MAQFARVVQLQGPEGPQGPPGPQGPQGVAPETLDGGDAAGGSSSLDFDGGGA